MAKPEVKITGAKELRKAIRKAESSDLKKKLRGAYKSSAGVVSTRAKQLTPVQSGDLRNSIRPLGTQTRAQIAAGKGKTRDYAGVIHYGDPHRGIEAQEFIHEAMSDEWRQVTDFFVNAMNEISKELST